MERFRDRAPAPAPREAHTRDEGTQQVSFRGLLDNRHRQEQALEVTRMIPKSLSTPGFVARIDTPERPLTEARQMAHAVMESFFSHDWGGGPQGTNLEGYQYPNAFAVASGDPRGGPQRGKTAGPDTITNEVL